MKEISQYPDIYNISYKIVNTNKRQKDLNNILSFDIEVSNGYRLPNGKVIPYTHKRYRKFIDNNKKRNAVGMKEMDKIPEYFDPVSLMYIWQLAVEDGKDTRVFIGRTWEDLKDFLNILDTAISNILVYKIPNPQNIDEDYRSYQLSKIKNKVNVHIYVHNLSYEFQHLRNVFNGNIKRLFAREKRKPMRFEVPIDHINLVFHDTLCLTQKSLNNWAKDEKLPVQKTHDLDYMEIRTPQTKLSKLELQYCINDVLIIVEGMKKYRDKYNGRLTNIPMTQTGEVRIKCRENVSIINHDYAEKCYNIDHSYSFKFYNLLVSAFAGGWTHANQKYSGQLMNDVVCYDFASSYPSVMTSFKGFPIEEFEKADPSIIDIIEQKPFNQRDYCYLIVVDIFNFESEIWNSFWSSSKCLESEGLVCDNGKIIAGDRIRVVLTDMDWDIFRKAYHIDNFDILECYIAKCGYLAKEMILTILDYFGKKTSLKGTGNLSMYTASKQFVNGIYGCFVFKEISDSVAFNGDWDKLFIETEEDFMSKMAMPSDPKKYEREVDKKFGTYQQGVWVTACARHRLFDAILELDSKIVYCDTDSVKGLFGPNEIKWFDDYNTRISKLQEEVANYYGFSVDLFSPLSSKGEKKQLGIFEREEDAVEFKALRAKVYAAKHKCGNTFDIETTIAGLPKKSGYAKVKDVDDLQPDTIWSPKQSKKLTCHYNDNQQKTEWHDKHGNVWISEDQYGITLEPVSFNLTLTDDYQRLLDIINGMCYVDYFDTTKILRNWEYSIDK